MTDQDQGPQVNLTTGEGVMTLFDADDAIRHARDALMVAETQLGDPLMRKDPVGWAKLGEGWATLALAIQGMQEQLRRPDGVALGIVREELHEVVEVLRPIAEDYAKRVEMDLPDRLNSEWSLERMLGGPDLVTKSKIQQALDEDGFYIQDLPAGKLETHRCDVSRRKVAGGKEWFCSRLFSDGAECRKVWTIKPNQDARHTADRYLTTPDELTEPS